MVPPMSGPGPTLLELALPFAEKLRSMVSPIFPVNCALWSGCAEKLPDND